jgi:hypothetical protein
VSLRDEVGQLLFESFPIPGRPVLPWEAQHPREQEYWRVVADLAIAHRGVEEDHANLVVYADAIGTALEMGRQLSARLVALRPYLRHAEGCAQAPCSCGLSGLLDTT